ncbi:MAG: hypothetical protein ACTSRT_07895 [Promethearchaeota archaeon]
MRFVINKEISLHLIGKETHIFFGGKKFGICKKVAFSSNLENILELTNTNKSLNELLDTIQSQSEYTMEYENIITAEEEFFVHCSNIQAWYESGYNTDLLDHRLSFPLLRMLVRNNDLDAMKVYKEEIARRFRSTFLPTVLYLLSGGFLDNFNKEELEMVMLGSNRDLENKSDLKKDLNFTELATNLFILQKLWLQYNDIKAELMLKSFIKKIIENNNS